MDYKGIIIEESLENKDVLEEVEILSTKVESVTQKHQTPWLTQWTLHEVLVPESKSASVAELISHSLDYSHKEAWYVDYKNKDYHYIIYKEKVFKVRRDSAEGYFQAKQYGVSLGIPEYQVDFSPEVKA